MKGDGTDVELVSVCKLVSKARIVDFKPAAPLLNRRFYLDSPRPWKLPEKLQPFTYFASKIKKSRKPYNVSYEDLEAQWSSQRGMCAVTGAKLVLPWKVGNDKLVGHWTDRASLDRVDNSKGYLVGNIRFVSQPVNIGRNSMTDFEFVEFCHDVAVKNL